MRGVFATVLAAGLAGVLVAWANLTMRHHMKRKKKRQEEDQDQPPWGTRQ